MTAIANLKRQKRDSNGHDRSFTFTGEVTVDTIGEIRRIQSKW